MLGKRRLGDDSAAEKDARRRMSLPTSFSDRSFGQLGSVLQDGAGGAGPATVDDLSQEQPVPLGDFDMFDSCPPLVDDLRVGGSEPRPHAQLGNGAVVASALATPTPDGVGESPAKGQPPNQKFSMRELIGKRRSCHGAFQTLKGKSDALQKRLQEILENVSSDNDAVAMVNPPTHISAMNESMKVTDAALCAMQKATADTFGEADDELASAMQASNECLQVLQEVLDALKDEVKVAKASGKKARGADRYKLQKLSGILASGQWPRTWVASGNRRP